jgi:hypothetical protein
VNSYFWGVVWVPEPLLEEPFGPMTVPLAVVVPFPLLVVVPLDVVVPPFGPVTDPVSAVPVRVLVTLPWALTVLPPALVAVPLPETVVPFCVTDPVAVPPRRPVTVCCAAAVESANDRAIAIDTEFFFMTSPGCSAFSTLARVSAMSGVLMSLSKSQRRGARVPDTSLHLPVTQMWHAGFW